MPAGTTQFGQADLPNTEIHTEATFHAPEVAEGSQGPTTVLSRAQRGKKHVNNEHRGKNQNQGASAEGLEPPKIGRPSGRLRGQTCEWFRTWSTSTKRAPLSTSNPPLHCSRRRLLRLRASLTRRQVIEQVQS